jgi:aminoglycoside/choline kinase family phosphotransferase
VGKFPAAGPESRAAGVTLGNYAREVKFYQKLASRALIRTPRVFFTDVNDATHDFVLMMEDLAPATQGDQLKGVTLEQAFQVMEEAAKLHASFWENPELDGYAFVSGSQTAPPSVISEAVLTPIWAGFCDRYADRVTPAARRVGETLCANIVRYITRAGPRCLTHNDFRPDNMMFATAAGGHPVTTLDWQSIGYGPGATDVGYFLAGAIASDLRRAHESDLTGAYLAKLSALGVSGYAEFQRDYAFGAFQLFLTAFFAAMVVTQTARGDEMFFQMVNSATAHIADHGALALLRP